MDSAEEKSARGYRDNYLIIVHSNGAIRWQYQTLSRSFCEIDIMNFPFDEQVIIKKTLIFACFSISF
jgi:hypothetical protein